MNIFSTLNILINELKRTGVNFNEQGYPIPKKEWFYTDITKCDTIIPFHHRLSAKNKKKTILCFYTPDIYLYRKMDIKKLDSLIDEMKEYGGFVGFDLSIFHDFLYPFQELHILANLVISSYIAMKIGNYIPNLREDEKGGSYFELFSKAPIVCCGTLGCSKIKIIRELNIKSITKYATSHPKQLLIQYGSNLVKFSNTRHYQSFRRLCK